MRINGHNIEEVDKFNYLGVALEAQGVGMNRKHEPEINDIKLL